MIAIERVFECDDDMNKQTKREKGGEYKVMGNEIVNARQEWTINKWPQSNR